jgi:hypothetical protein
MNGVTAVGNGVGVAVGFRSRVSDTVNADTTPLGSCPIATVGTGVEVGVGVFVGLGIAVDVGGIWVDVGTGVGGTAVGLGVDVGSGVGVAVGGLGTRVAVAGTEVGTMIAVGTTVGSWVSLTVGVDALEEQPKSAVADAMAITKVSDICREM